jgi:hypothetical protein
MSNKDNLWRLQDAEGKPVAEKPKPKWKAIGDIVARMKMPDGTYKELGQIQPIRYSDIESRIYEIGSVNHVHPMMASGQITMTDLEDPVADATVDLAREQAASFINPVHHVTDTTTVQMIGAAETLTYRSINTERLRERIREQVIRMDEGYNMTRETIEQTIPNILDMIYREVHRYEARFYDRPMWISLDREHYRSYWLETRSVSVQRRYEMGAGEQSFAGIPIICNVAQAEPIMALGSPLQEGIEGRLYNE